jgi:hypothetical protein
MLLRVLLDLEKEDISIVLSHPATPNIGYPVLVLDMAETVDLITRLAEAGESLHNFKKESPCYREIGEF